MERIQLNKITRTRTWGTCVRSQGWRFLPEKTRSNLQFSEDSVGTSLTRRSKSCEGFGRMQRTNFGSNAYVQSLRNYIRFGTRMSYHWSTSDTSLYRPFVVNNSFTVPATSGSGCSGMLRKPNVVIWLGIEAALQTVCVLVLWTKRLSLELSSGVWIFLRSSSNVWAIIFRRC